MQILIDTCIWSLALRHKHYQDVCYIEELEAIISTHRANMIGPIRQEILSGIKEVRQYKKLRDTLNAFPDIPIIQQDYETAAEIFNQLRSQGIQGSNTDFLICAVAQRREMSIFTVDQDFVLFAQHIDIKLHSIPDSLPPLRIQEKI